MRFLNFFKKKKEIIYESSLSRVWKFVEEDKYSFGIISPFRKTKTSKENEEDYQELKKLLKKLGYGYIELKGRYVEGGGIVDEKSFFVPSITKKKLIELGKKYDQDSVIYKDVNEFVEIDKNGKVITNFVKASGRGNLTFDKELFKEVFSALKKGSHRGKKFLFTLQEKEIFQFNEYAYSRRGEKPQWITVFQDYIK